MPFHDTATVAAPGASEVGCRRRVMLVGPGFRFLSGLSVYTCRLANALVDSLDASVVLLDRLIPKRFYPGGARVGHDLSSMRYDQRVRIVAHVDWYWWYWSQSMSQIANAMRTERPDVIVLQWWTAATLHTYLRVARLAARAGIPLVIEFHEVQDTGEAAIPGAAWYCRRYLRRLISRASGGIFHSQHDFLLLQSIMGSHVFDSLAVEFAPHGPYDHLTAPTSPPTPAADADHGDAGVTGVLSFGLIRPYKGVEDLVRAVDAMSDEQASQFEIAVVGETWEGWRLPADAIAASRHRGRIRFDNRYVSDAEAAEYFAAADVLVLPYRRGSASGPLQIAMNNGIFVVMYAVEGLVDAVRNYRGAVLVPPNDVVALRDALLSIGPRRRERFADPHSWSPMIRAIESLMDSRCPA